MLSHQSLGGDLLGVGEHFFRQIVANTNIKLCLRQDDPTDAEYFAKLSGTRTTTKRTTQVQAGALLEHETGMGSDRDVEEFNISPNTIKSLTRGQAGLICSDPRSVDVVQLDAHLHSAPPLVLLARKHPETAPAGGVRLRGGAAEQSVASSAAVRDRSGSAGDAFENSKERVSDLTNQFRRG